MVMRTRVTQPLQNINKHFLFKDFQKSASVSVLETSRRFSIFSYFKIEHTRFANNRQISYQIPKLFGRKHQVFEAELGGIDRSSLR